MMKLIKTVKGIQILRSDDGSFMLQGPDGALLGTFTLLKTANGWEAFIDGKCADEPTTRSYATSFAADVSEGDVKLD